ncbi:MAG: VOC family protein [Pseudomonadota bacterium]
MPTQMYVSLPVKELDKTVAFFTALGFKFNAQFSNGKAACMIVNEGASYVMLMAEPFFRTFTPRPVPDAKTTAAALISLSQNSREDVDAMVKKAIAAGGSTLNNPQDHGFMYEHDFEDPDGHLWGVMWMNPAHATAPQATGQPA